MALIHPTMVASTLFIHNKYTAGTCFIIARPNLYNYSNPGNHDFDNSVRDGWRMWLVTCAHCIEPNRQDLITTIETNVYPGLESQKLCWNFERKEWAVHPEYVDKDKTPHYDIAVAKAPTNHVYWTQAVEPAYWPAHWHLSRNRMKNEGIVEGDEIFFVGFPLEEGQGDRNYPLVRHGIISQCQPYIRQQSELIFVDGAIWPGNSGGPVVTKPAAIALKNTSRYKNSSLLGMIQSVSALEDRNAEVIMLAGTGKVIPIQTINELVDNIVGDT